MAAHTNAGPSGAVNYYRPTAGKLVNDTTKEQFSAVSGTLDRLTLSYDEGDKSKKIGPGWVMRIGLKDKETVEVISIKLTSTIGRMVGSRILNVEKGQSALISVWPGDDPKITLGTVKKQDPFGDDPDTWEKVLPAMELPATGWEKPIEEATRKHPAFYDPPKDTADPYAK